MAMSKVDCEKLLERAHLLGMDAGRGSTPTPMVVGTPTETFGSEIDHSKPTYFVEGGVCGFAGVVIKPARGKFVSYLKSLDMGYKHYYGGYYVPVRVFGQSLERKEAYAEAFAKALSECGMSCYVDSRMD
tara:strand:- start:7 stop:396 length:390 start_codon:yes stop_codon:yes gene_type:complete